MMPTTDVLDKLRRLKSVISLKSLASAETARAQSSEELAYLHFQNALVLKSRHDELEWFGVLHPYFETYLVEYGVCTLEEAQNLAKAR